LLVLGLVVGSVTAAGFARQEGIATGLAVGFVVGVIVALLPPALQLIASDGVTLRLRDGMLMEEWQRRSLDEDRRPRRWKCADIADIRAHRTGINIQTNGKWMTDHVGLMRPDEAAWVAHTLRQELGLAVTPSRD
jgi:hypothetical protein